MHATKGAFLSVGSFPLEHHTQKAGRHSLTHVLLAILSKTRHLPCMVVEAAQNVALEATLLLLVSYEHFELVALS